MYCRLAASFSAVVAAVCSIGGPNPCSTSAVFVSVSASGIGTARTAYQVTQNTATEADLVMSTATLTIGAAGMGTALKSTPLVGVGASFVQWGWDIFGPQ